MDVTALAAPSSYFCRPSFPAPVMKVIRIISVQGKGVENADWMVVVMVLVLAPARSKVSLSVATLILAAIPLTLDAIIDINSLVY